MKNFKIKDVETGKEFWISPAIAVTGIVVTKPTINNGERRYLVEKRGDGVPDFKGKYCFPCGYYDFSDCYLREATLREIYEETGLSNIRAEDLHFVGINDGIHTNRGNITVRYLAELDIPVKDLLVMIKDLDSAKRGGERGEVSELSLVTYDWIKKHRSDFCFNHDELADTIEKHIGEILSDRFYTDNYGE